MDEAKVDPHHSPLPAPGPVNDDCILTSCTSYLCFHGRAKAIRTNGGRGARTQTPRKKPFPQVLLCASQHPYSQITPLNSIYSETIRNKKIAGRAHMGSNYETEIGHSVTNIISFSFSENASLISFIPSLNAQPYYSSPYQTALGGHFCFVCDT